MPKLGSSRELDSGFCRDCNAPIYWVTMASTGAKMPLDRGGTNRIIVEGAGARVVKAYRTHWETCPYAERNRKAGPKKAGSR